MLGHHAGRFVPQDSPKSGAGRFTFHRPVESSLPVIEPGQFVEFSELFEPQMGVPVLVVSFLALLELTRESLVDLSQKSPFEPIYVKLKSERPTLAIA